MLPLALMSVLSKGTNIVTRNSHKPVMVFPSPTVRGRQLPEWVEPIMALKRQKRDEEAFELLVECLDAAEVDAHRIFPAPWYTWQAAVIYRQRGQYGAEVEVLERWVDASPASYDPSMWGASARRMFPRLERAREIAQRKSPGAQN